MTDARISHDAADLIAIFDRLFVDAHQTCLRGGFDEPFYQPRGDGRPLHEIQFRCDYFASALHEIAHWLVAGPERRRQPDYGYWYVPDGRDAATQRAFEQVEHRPQALEWILSAACGFRFRPSTDNLYGEVGDTSGFQEQVLASVRGYLQAGLNERATRLRAALAVHFGQPLHDSEHFSLEALR